MRNIDENILNISNIFLLIKKLYQIISQTMNNYNTFNIYSFFDICCLFILGWQQYYRRDSIKLYAL